MNAEYVEQKNDDLSVVNTARVSFAKISETFTDKDVGLIRYLAKHNHWTPFAHQRFTFECDGEIFKTTPTDPLLMAGMVHNSDFSKVRHSFYGWVKLLKSGLIMDDCVGDIQIELWSAMPVSSDAFDVDQDEPEFNCQLVTEETDPLFIDVTFRMDAPVPIRTQCFKHKHGFVENEESRRYISSRPVVHVPDAFRASAANVKQGSAGTHAVGWMWRAVYQCLTWVMVSVYMLMIRCNVCPEQARFILPQGCIVNWIWTGNLASFARFYKDRTYDKAQKEVQDLAHMVGDIIAPLYPVSWAALINEEEMK